MNLGAAAASLRMGRPVRIKAYGSSMAPRIKNAQIVNIEPLHGAPPEIGQVVLARVNGRWYLHMVTARRRGQVQISNNKGHVNGWTSLSNVVGVVKEE